MKDAEFIELLNLYLDHEISPADAARLEAEVHGNPARLRIYQDYCRMEKACKLLAGKFETETVPALTDKVIPFEPAEGSTRRTGIYAIGLLAGAAACVAIVFIGRNGGSSPVGPGAAEKQFADDGAVGLRVAAPPAAADVAGVGDSTRAIGHLVNLPIRRDPQPMLVGNPLLLSGKTRSEAALASAVDQANTQFEWMRTVSFAPIQQRNPLEDLSFKAQPTSLQPASRTYGGPESLQGAVESVGFSITK
jgi:hypothetical protein